MSDLTDDLREYARSLGDGDQFDNVRGEMVASAADRIDLLEARIVGLRRWRKSKDAHIEKLEAALYEYTSHDRRPR